MDVPSPVDLKDMNDARDWAAQVMKRRPYRTTFFNEIRNQLEQSGARTVLELGSGPGFLAEHLLNTLSRIQYTAFDFSDAMHFLAKERLESRTSAVRFVTGDFIKIGWEADLGKFDAIITVQAVHELRHKSKTPALFGAVKSLLMDGGMFLYCDHFYDEGGMENNELYLSAEEQESCLNGAGFSSVKKLVNIGTLNLWTAMNLSY